MSKHLKTKLPSNTDLKRNPLIGGSRGTTMSGTTPEPPPTSCTGVAPSGRHTNHPPSGPRSSTAHATGSAWVRKGDTSPSGTRSKVTSTVAQGPAADETE